MQKPPTHQELLDRIARLERQLQERTDGGIARSADRSEGSDDTAADRNHDLADRLRFIETLFDTIPNPVFYKNSAGVYLGCNQSFADLILGVPQDRIIGRSLYDLPDLIPKKLADIYHEKDLALLNNPGHQVYETKVKCADGQYRDFVFSKATYPDHRGRVAGIVGLMVDVTEQNRIKSQLKESEEKYRSMMESMTDAVYICSPDFHISYMNPKMIERVGYDASGLQCHKVLHSLESPCPWCTFAKVTMGEQTEVEVVSPKDGKTYMVTNSPIFHEDGSISKMTIYRDITQRKRLEKELLVARKIEATGVFAGGIAHDYNNLLFIILGNILMSKRALDENSEVISLLETAEKAARKAAKLTRRLLAFTHGDALSLKDHPVGDLIEDALKSLESTARYPVELRLADDLRTVHVDGGLISIALHNILQNAREAMKDGGPIIITATNILPDDRSGADKTLPDNHGNCVCIAVSDRGTGIDKDILPQIFDPYFSTKQRDAKKGLGLGLSTAYSIIHKHSGVIRVDSAKDAGTTVSIYLPTDDRAASARIDPVVISM
jgi:PAS domain S-box-containing protein